MCLHVRKKFTTYEKAKIYADNPCIADKDIVVWKILRVEKSGELFSPSFCTSYSNKIDIEVLSFNTEIIHKLYSTYPNNRFCFKVIIEQGLHTIKSRATAESRIKNYSSSEKYKSFKMIIPKYTPYFFGECNEIVSLKLKWPK